MSDYVVVIMDPEDEGRSHTTEEALATLAEMPPGIGFGALINQDLGGYGIAVITTAPKPMLPAYLMIAYDVLPEDAVPECHTAIGYENFAEFGVVIGHAPLAYPPRGWVRMDTLATYWMMQLEDAYEQGEVSEVER